MRTRSQGEIVSTPVNTYTRTTNCAGVVSSVDNFSTSVRNGRTKVMVDSVTPNFHSLSSKGHTFCNAFSSVETIETGVVVGEDVQTFIPTCATTKKIAYGPWANNANSLNSDPNGSHSSNLNTAITLASTEALANVEQPDIQGLVEMAEFGKTLRTVPDLVRSSTRALQSLLKSKSFRKSGKTVMEYCSSTYLAARYGITPVISTVESIGKALNRATSEPVRKTARGSAGIPSLVLETSTTYPGSIQVVGTTYTSKTTKIRAGVLYEQRLDFDAYGTRVQELPSALWELTTLSFAADWFVNVGDYLRAVTPKTGVTVLQSWVTTETVEVKRSSYRTVANNTDPNWNLVCGRSGTSTVIVISKSRSCGISAGLATKFHEINFEKSKDFLHAADSLALFAQLLMRKR